MRILTILILCFLLSACQPYSAESLPIHSPTPDAGPTSAQEEGEPDLYEKTELCDVIDWEISDGRSIHVELQYVTLEDISGSFYDGFLYLTLSRENVDRKYRFEEEGLLPSYYLYPCNITGSGRDLFVSKATTSVGIEVWKYELFTLSDDTDLVPICSYHENFPYAQIPVRKESCRDSVRIFAEATDLNEEIMLMDYSAPVDPVDSISGGVYTLEEGRSIAGTLHHHDFPLLFPSMLCFSYLRC